MFKGVVVAKDKGKIPFAKIRMINMDNGKIKELESDINGKFEQLLFINKTYKIYINKMHNKLIFHGFKNKYSAAYTFQKE